jgi:hypothetical protein
VNGSKLTHTDILEVEGVWYLPLSTKVASNWSLEGSVAQQVQPSVMFHVNGRSFSFHYHAYLLLQLPLKVDF